MILVLLEPEIPQNTGNIGRLASAAGAELWLVGRLGFALTNRHMKRSGMDYWDKVTLRRIPTLAEFYPLITPETAFISTKGHSLHTGIPADVDMLVFGCEGSGLPQYIYDTYPAQLYRIPMLEGIRSLNLASSAAIALYSYMEKNNFPNLA